MSGEVHDQNWYSDEIATFGDRLAAARDAAGMSQKELAQRMGIKTSTLRSWEDDLAEPRANRLSIFAGLLGVSLSWLLSGEGEGLAPPDLDETSHEDTGAMLSDLRAIRTQISQANTRLAQLEKRLRSMGAV